MGFYRRHYGVGRAKGRGARLVVLYAAAFGDVFDYGRHFTNPAGCGKGLGRIVYARLVETRRFQGLGGGIRADFLFAFHLLRHYGYLFFLFEEKTDLGGTGLVVGFANSSFELLAGIGVFAALGFMAQAGGKAVNEVASGGIGLAFIAFPTIINQAPMGWLIGILFFGSLVFAGVTSMISILEVIVAAIQDKLNIGRVNATLLVCIPMGIVSTLLFGTATGLPVLDVMDKFVNTYGIVAAGFVYVAAIIISGRLPELRKHLNALSSIRIGGLWTVCVVVTVVMLGYMLFKDTSGLMEKNYEGYPDGFLSIFGWGMSAALVVFGLLLSLLPWKHGQDFNVKDEHEHEQGEEK